jgi:uncharacterized protein YneR
MDDQQQNPLANTDLLRVEQQVQAYWREHRDSMSDGERVRLLKRFGDELDPKLRQRFCLAVARTTPKRHR